MLTKIAGTCLLVAGAVLAFSVLGGLVVGAMALVWLLLKVALVAGLILLGWRWINGGAVLAKIGGAFLLVGGIVLAFPLFGSIVAGTLGVMFFLVKVVLVGGLAYLGWCWISGRKPNWPKLRRL